MGRLVLAVGRVSWAFGMCMIPVGLAARVTTDGPSSPGARIDQEA